VFEREKALQAEFDLQRKRIITLEALVVEMRDEMNQIKNVERTEYVRVKESSIVRSDLGSVAPTTSEHSKNLQVNRQVASKLITQPESRQSSNTTNSQSTNQYPYEGF
jgi:hypothetical protein